MTKAAADAACPIFGTTRIAAGLDEPGLLLYRSNLLGSDLRITNFGGGNTSAKVDDDRSADRRADVTVLWVKGSGGDIGSMKLDGFSTLYLDKLESLKALYRGLDHEDEMVALFNHCTFNLNPRATSIDTPLHGFVPHRHVDHVHADAVIAIAACANAEALTREIFGGELGFLPWQRPGFDLGLKLGEMAARQSRICRAWCSAATACSPGARRRKLLRDHVARSSSKAADWLAATRARSRPSAVPRVEAAAPETRRAVAATLMPLIRGKISARRAQDRPFHRRAGSAGVRQFAARSTTLAPLGTSCPGSFPAHQDPPAGAALRSRARQSRRR